MGCGASIGKYTHDNKRLLIEKNEYNIRHEVLEKNIGNGIKELEIIIKSDSINIQDEYEQMLKNIITKCNLYGIDAMEIKVAILEILSQEFIKKLFDFKDYDVLNFMKENLGILSGLKIPENKNYLYNYINNSTRLLSRIQKGLHIKIEENIQNEYINYNTIFNNLKFNNSYSVEMLTIKFNKFMAVNPALCSLIEDLLISQKSLSSLIIDINDEKNKLTQEFINNVNCIFFKLNNFKDLKIFALRNMNIKDNLKSSPEIECGILNLIEKDSLIGICLSKLKISNSFFVKLSENIEKLKNLKVLLLEAYNNSTYLDILMKGILKNSSLHVVVFAGFPLDITKVIEYKHSQKLNNNLKYLDVQEQFDFQS